MQFGNNADKCKTPITCLLFSKCNLLTACVELNASYANLYKWYLHVLCVHCQYCHYSLFVDSNLFSLLLLCVVCCCLQRSYAISVVCIDSHMSLFTHTGKPVDTTFIDFQANADASPIKIHSGARIGLPNRYIINSSIVQNCQYMLHM